MPIPEVIWSIGHSTRTIEAFISLLQHHGIKAIADVRRFPGSKRLPQFGSANLAASLAEHDIGYQWFEDLGGRRRATPASASSAWRNASFRGYSEHVHSEAFEAGLDDLMKLAEQYPTAMMCAEVLWWRCHRSIISDVLKLQGVEVRHIQDEKRITVHPYTSPARLFEGRLSYAEDAGEPLKDRR